MDLLLDSGDGDAWEAYCLRVAYGLGDII